MNLPSMKTWPLVYLGVQLADAVTKTVASGDK